MIRKRFIMLLIISLIATSFCQAQSNLKNSLQSENLKGKVKCVKTIYYLEDEKDKKNSTNYLNDSKTKLYDTNGNLIASYDSIGNVLRGKILYFYDAKGSLTELHKCFADGTLFERRTFRDVGNNLREQCTDDYVNDVLVVRRDTLEYDNNGNIIRRTLHMRNEDAGHYISDIYDSKGHLLTVCDNSDKTYLSASTFKYNKNGDVIEEKVIERFRNFVYISKYKYKYDKNKNWIKQTGKERHWNDKTKDNKIITRATTIVERTIEYYE
ncbi:MAG: hypothetical protein LBO06_01425 [Bacteroidales bacterium]|nr:hypothetical protein [Bacteroidales bacterium]